MTEDRETRIKRLKMRSMRRGIKEIDLILSQYSARLDAMSDAQIDHYEILLDESDHDLYAWVSGAAETPLEYLDLITDISKHFKV